MHGNAGVPLSLLSILMLRKCTRVGNSEMAVHAQVILGELFYSKNYDHIHGVALPGHGHPPESPTLIQQFLKENNTFKVTNNTDRLKGGEFVLEGRNHRTKMCAPPGVPSDQQWLRTCRMLDPVEEVPI